MNIPGIQNSRDKDQNWLLPECEGFRAEKAEKGWIHYPLNFLDGFLSQNTEWSVNHLLNLQDKQT